MIEVSNLRKQFGAIVAVDGISFSVNAAETFGLLGPNGAGKTTTISLIVGALRPDSGSITVAGESDPTRPEARLKIGTAPQALALYEDLTAEENLSFFGHLFKLTGADLRTRVDWALEFSGLSARRSDRVKTFSGGMQRRLNLVCGLLHDPQVILLDEPTVGIDPQSRNLIFENIESLKKLGRTIIYTTHYMEEAQRLCDRVAIVDQGKILALDSVDNLIARYGGLPAVEVEFTSAPHVGADLPGEIQGNKLRTRTEDPVGFLARISSGGYEFRNVKIERANLEEVFLSLTGKSLRD
jgi:ABC-2 type transport system ATP-binding protein